MGRTFGFGGIVRRLAMVAGLMALWGTAEPIRAQTDVIGLDDDVPAAAPPAPRDEAEVQERVTLLGQIRQGGWAMIPLGLFSVLVLALAIFNGIQLRKVNFCPPSLTDELKKLMGGCRLRSAMDVSARSPTYLGRLMAAALPHVDARDHDTMGREAFQEAAAEFAMGANSRHMIWINYFSVLAQASPMLGLLGTVSGMIRAFSHLGQEGMGRPQEIAANISEALVTTATGLIIALPALFCYFIFRNKLNQLVAECLETADHLLATSVKAINPNLLDQTLPEGFEGEGGTGALNQTGAQEAAAPA